MSVYSRKEAIESEWSVLSGNRYKVHLAVNVELNLKLSGEAGEYRAT